MSERGRSSLFGRPGALLVEETAPRIAMPSPPVRGRAPEVERFDPIVDAGDDDESPAAGPLQVFVGASGAEHTSPGMMNANAMDELGDVFGRPPPPSRIERVELPEPRVGVSARPGVAVRPPPAAPSSPPIVRQRSQGIATAATRARSPTVPIEPPLVNPFADDENTNVEIMPIEIFDTPRGATERPAKVPPWDEPRARRTHPSEISFPGNARIPPRSSTFEGRTGEPTNPGELFVPFGEISSPGRPAPASLSVPVSAPPLFATPAPLSTPPGLSTSAGFGTPAPAAGAQAPRPMPTVALLARPPAPPPRQRLRLGRPSRRQVLAVAAVVVLLAAGVGAWRWEHSNPGGFAALGDRLTTQIATIRAPARVVDAGTAPVVGAAAPDPIASGAELSAAPAAPAAVVSAEVPPEVPPEVVPAEVVAVEPTPVAPVPVAPPAAVVPVAKAGATPLEERRGDFQTATGFLQVLCNKKATIYVDNVKMGSTADHASIELTAGTHRVKVVGSNGRSRTMDVRIDAGRPRQVQLDLR
ncbi:MAG: hypothetical protein V4850_09325 [Myxococcota bacterium]